MSRNQLLLRNLQLEHKKSKTVELHYLVLMTMCEMRFSVLCRPLTTAASPANHGITQVGAVLLHSIDFVSSIQSIKTTNVAASTTPTTSSTIPLCHFLFRQICIFHILMKGGEWSFGNVNETPCIKRPKLRYFCSFLTPKRVMKKPKIKLPTPMKNAGM